MLPLPPCSHLQLHIVSLLLCFFVCRPSNGSFSVNWCLLPQLFLQAKYKHPPSSTIFNTVLQPSRVYASPGACLQFSVHTCMFSQAGCLKDSDVGVLFRGFLSLSLSHLLLSFFYNSFCIYVAESFVEEAWHSIFCCTCWQLVIHAPTFGALLV